MKTGLNLLLANTLAIICLVMVYLLVERGHTGFAVACMILAYFSACSPGDNDKEENKEVRDKVRDGSDKPGRSVFAGMEKESL